MHKNNQLCILLIAMVTIVGACSGGGGGSNPSSGSVATNLHAVFYRTLTAAPVQSIKLLRQNGDPIPNNTITFDTRVDAADIRLAGNSTLKQTSTDGTADFALSSGTYSMVISEPSTTVLIGGLRDTLAVSSSGMKIYQTSQQNWTVTSSKAFSSLYIEIYQTDTSGNLNYGTLVRPFNPRVLFEYLDYSATPRTSAQFTTELFKGSYRAVITATPANPTDSIPPYITPATSIINASGDGKTDTVPTIDFSTVAGNILSLTLYDDATPISSSTASYYVEVYDRTSRLYIGSDTNDSNGVASVLTGNSTNIVAVVSRYAGILSYPVEAIKTYTTTPTFSASLRKYSVTGSVVPPSGGTLDAADTTMQVTAKINSGLGDYFDKMLAKDPLLGAVSSLGVIQNFKLFEGAYILSAKIKKYPDSDKKNLTFSGQAPASQNINVKAGGLIRGRVQDYQTNNDIAGVSVSLRDTDTNEIVGSSTTAADGSYEIAVPFGTYNLFISGAVNLNIAVNTATVVKDLRRFTITGRLIDSSGSGLAGRISTSAGGTTTAGSLGTFSLQLYEGENWAMFTPPADKPSLGAQVEPRVLINSSTITSN